MLRLRIKFWPWKAIAINLVTVAVLMLLFFKFNDLHYQQESERVTCRAYVGGHVNCD